MSKPQTFRRELLSAAAIAIVVATAPQPVGARGSAVLTYFLPETIVSATVRQRLVSCPAAGGGNVVVETSWNLIPVARPDYDALVQIDASTGFLANRSTELTLNPNGTLVSINSEAEGQGAEVVEAVLGLVGTVAPMLVSTARDSLPEDIAASQATGTTPHRCTQAIRDLLTSRADLAEAVANGEELIRQGEASQAQQDQLARDKQMLAATEAALTVSRSATAELNNTIGGLSAQTSLADLSGNIVVGAPDISIWFEPDYVAETSYVDEVREKVPGQQHGFHISWAASRSAAAAMRLGNGASWNSGQVGTDLVYRRPVPAQMLAYPCRSAPAADNTCTRDTSPGGRAATGALGFSLPQLSIPSLIPIGSAGIFGSRTVSAAFDASGAPVRLSYGSSSGAEGIAASIESGGAALGELRDARLNAIRRETELLEAEQTLEQYREQQEGEE